MELLQQENTYLTLTDDYGRVRNEMIFIIAKSGYGKGLASEAMIEEFHDQGYIIINIADPKEEVELGFAMFEPTEPYHTRNLTAVGKKKASKPVKLYHPFTFNIPKGKLPDINFYTFSLKELGRKEWSMVAESSWDTDTIKLCLNASSNITKEDGLYGYLHYLQNIIKGKKDKRYVEPDWKNFGLSVTSGTSKSLQDIGNYFQPFKQDYFLSKDNVDTKLNWKEILQDQTHYHVFLYKWLSDPKLKHFTVLTLFNQIIQNKDYAKHPILVFIPEIKYLTPYKPQGYKMFLAEGIKENLSMMRSQGKGMSCLYDTQVFSDVDEAVRNSSTTTFFGELGGASDQEKVAKAMNYKRDVRKQLLKTDYPNSYLVSGREDLGAFRIWFPSHAHCEPHYNFLNKYRREYPDSLKDYSELRKRMKDMLKKEEQKFRDILKKERKEKHKKDEAIKKAKEEGSEENTKVKKKMEKAQEIQDKSKEHIMRLCWETKRDSPKLSYREIGRRFEVHKDTAKKYIDAYEQINKEDQEEDLTEELKNHSLSEEEKEMVMEEENEDTNEK